MMKKLICFFLILIFFPFGGALAESTQVASPVDNVSALPDGTYLPTSFSFSGGTGKVKIGCSEIIIEDGHSYATLSFSSSSYQYVRISDETYYTEVIDGKSVVTIPVILNQNNQIFALTTKMSTPHEIEYQILVQLSDDQTDDDPMLAGFQLMDEYHSDVLQIAYYGPGIAVFKISISETDIPAEDTEHDNSAMLYCTNPIQYLAAPKDAELPAGIEEQYVIIRTPLRNIAVADKETRALLTECGFEDTMILDFNADEPDYRSLILHKIEAVFADESTMPALSQNPIDRFSTLQIPVIVMHSDSEDADIWNSLFSFLLKGEN